MATVVYSSARRFVDTIDAPSSFTSTPSVPDPELYDEWFNNTNNKRWLCVDATPGALVWRRVIVPIFRSLATLTAGSVSVSLPALTAGMLIKICVVTPGGVPGALFISSKTPGVGFTISSTSLLDSSFVLYQIEI
jgi:hypothetical protein